MKSKTLRNPLITLYQHIDTNTRGYKGIQIDDAEMTDYLEKPVFDNLIDVEVQQESLNELLELQNTTGFSSKNLLADIQAFQNPTPNDLRSWRVGEALAEVVLESYFNCRFPWNELRDARNPKGNKTGADLVGFIEVDGEVMFLFGEVKTSSELAKRPPQVMTKSDGIENQLKDLYESRHKRRILITYLKTKTTIKVPIKVDYDKAIKSYYADKYVLIGGLIRDVPPDEKDVLPSYNKLKAIILSPIGLNLFAIYTSIKKENWRNIIEGNSINE